MTTPSGNAATASSFLTFRSNGTLYALPTTDIAEVLATPPVARVPHAPAGLLGLANFRGRVLPVATLRGLHGQPAGAPEGWAILVEGIVEAALAVDSIEGIATVEPDAILSREAEIATAKGEKLAGAFRRGADVAGIIDLPSLLSGAFASRRERRVARGSTVMADADLTDAPVAERRMLVTFAAGGQEFGLDIGAVREIAALPAEIARVPGSDPVVLGVVPFRDSLLPLLSLRGLLGLPGESIARPKIVVTEVGGVPVGLLADEARSILAADEDLIEPTPRLLAARAGGETRVRGIYRDAGGDRLVAILSTETLFSEEIMQRLSRAGSTSAIAAPDAAVETSSAEMSLLVFRLGDDEFGLPIAAVEEVARVPEQIARVPKTPAFLEGVVNLRGAVLPVIDQRRRFDMPERDAGAPRRLVVVTSGAHRAGLVVDDVSDVLRILADSIEPAPDLVGQATPLVVGVVSIGMSGRIVMVLDPTELLSRTERKLLDAFAAVAEGTT